MASLAKRPPVFDPSTQLAAREGAVHRVAITLLCIYLIGIISRIPEILTLSIGVNLRLSLIVLILCLLAATVDGGMARMFSSKITVVFVMLALWVVLTVPVSIWRGGSVAIIVNYWITSVATYFIVAGAPGTLRDCRKLMCSIAIACFILLLFYVKFGNVIVEGRVGFEIPSLGNPNLFALQLIFALPFCSLLGKPFSFLSFARIVGIFYGLFAIGRTGSRGAFLALSLLFLVLLVSASFFRKLLLVGSVFVVGLVVVATSSSSIVDRYKELFASAEGEASSPGSEAFEGAISSREARQRHLRESVVLTLRNPLFGVGPGMFQVASSDAKFTGGARGAWRETHNTLTQFSSECGLPAAFLFLGILFYCLKTPFSLYRLAKRNKDLTMLAEMSYCLFLSAIGLFVTSMFASVAYQFYYPVLLGLVVALRRTADVEISRVVQATAYSPTSLRKPAKQPAPRPWRGLVSAPLLPRQR
jgi:O-antigen ligase